MIISFFFSSGLFNMDVTYNLAMKAADEAGNMSPLSNIKQFYLDSAAPGVYLSSLFIIVNIIVAIFL